MRIGDPLAQQRIDQTPLMSVHLNPRSRDETVMMMRGLQAVYADLATRQAILALIRRDVLGDVRDDVGRPGMDLWSIFVLLCCREALRLDYDRLEDLAENHRLVRAAMGIGEWQAKHVFDWTRIWRNVRKVGPETLADINRRVVQLGHQVALTASASVQVDSFVMQTNVHHPSDIRQVADGLRVVLRHATRLAETIGSTLLRQHVPLERRSRSLVLTASRASASKHRDSAERLARAVTALCDFADERCAQALVLSDQFHAVEDRLDILTHAQAAGDHQVLITTSVVVKPLLAHLPELGQVNRQEIAALAGVAPYNNDSGMHRGTRSIYGGRQRVRNAVHMAAVCAMRFDATCTAFYNALRERGKPAKLAIVAVIRKMLIRLNSLVAAYRQKQTIALPTGT